MLASGANIQGWIETSSALVAAVGTIAAVVVALFLQYVLTLRQRPKLYLSFSSDRESEDIVGHDRREMSRAFIRFKVHAATGRSTAHNVEVFLMRARRPASAIVRRPVPDRPFKWVGRGTSPKIDIPSGAWRRFDLLHYRIEHEGERRQLLTPALIQEDGIDPMTLPPDYHWYLKDPGTYEFELSLTADGIDATEWTVRFDFAPAPASNADEMITHITNLAWSENARRAGPAL